MNDLGVVVCAPEPPAVCQLCVIVFSMYHLFPSAKVGCLFTMTTAALVNLSQAARAVAFTAWMSLELQFGSSAVPSVFCTVCHQGSNADLLFLRRDGNSFRMECR